MPQYDMRTIFACYAFISFVCAAFMASQWRHYRGRYRGLGLWLLDYALQLAGICLIGARGSIPDILSVTLGNAAIIVGFVVLLRGVRLYFGLQGKALVDWSIAVLFVAVHGWFSTAEPDLSAREIAFSLAMIALCGRGLASLGKLGGRDRRAAVGTSSVLWAFCLASLARIAVDLAAPTRMDIFAGRSYDPLILVAYMALFMALTFSLVSMVGRRIYLDQEGVIAEKSLAEGALRSSEERFSKAFKASPDAMAISRLSDGRFIEVNETFCRLSGYSREEALGEPPIDVWGEVDARQALVAELLGSSLVREREIRVVVKGGKRIRVAYSGGIVELGGERHILSIIRDLAERERAGMILRTRLELREYAAGHSTEELMVEAVDIIEAMTGSSIGFYHFVDEDKGVLERQAWSTRTLAEFCEADSGKAHYPIEKAGVWADCIRLRRPVVHNDYPAVPGRRGLPEGHAEVRRELVAPTMRDGKVVAILGVGNKATDYDQEDVALVSYIVDLVWTIVVEKRNAERIVELNGRLEKLAMTDELTGMANRRAFMAFAERELQKAKRYSTPLSFLMLDIDHFKEVNDSYGHDSGDAILRMLSEVARSQVRDVDISARLGGEEFGILMPSTRLSDAALSAERLRAAIEAAYCEHLGVELRITVSIGVSTKTGEESSIDTIMRDADRALYRAKAAGRNRVETDRARDGSI